MKKTIAFLLCILLILSLIGCGQNPIETTTAQTETQPQTTAAPVHTLRVGFGRSDMTPQAPMPIGDPYLGKPKTSTAVLDPLLISCVALSDENDNTVLLFHMDLGNIRETEINARVPISEELGIPVDNIIVAATHTHATPRLATSHEGVMAWNDAKPALMLQAARDAMADRKPAQMYTSAITCPNMNFIRHYVLDNGKYAGDNFGSFSKANIVKHTEDADNTLQLIKFVREGGKDVVLANWQGHPHRANSGGGTVITSDIVGVMRATMEEQTDCLFAYFSGASGNINNSSRIPGETITKDYIEHGQKLAEFAQQAEENYILREVGPVQVLTRQFVATLKHTTRTAEIPISAFSLGDVAFVAAPYEMFNSKGMEIKNFSPFEVTFISTYTNGGHGYLPDEKTTNAYQSYEQTQTRYVLGTADLISLEHIAMLKELYPTAK